MNSAIHHVKHDYLLADLTAGIPLMSSDKLKSSFRYGYNTGVIKFLHVNLCRYTICQE